MKMHFLSGINGQRILVLFSHFNTLSIFWVSNNLSIFSVLSYSYYHKVITPYELCEKGIFLVHEELMVDNVVVLSKSVYHPPYYNYYFNSQFYQEWFYKAQYIHPLNKNIRELQLIFGLDFARKTFENFCKAQNQRLQIKGEVWSYQKLNL